MDEKRKVSNTGIISWKGVKYYIKDKDFRGKIVSIEEKKDHILLTSQYLKKSKVAHPVQISTFGAHRLCPPNPYYPLSPPSIDEDKE